MLDVYRPYPGVALVVTAKGSVLLGAPADAFKATKAFCQQHRLPFPRVLVAPQRLLAEANPQFVPEFFLYDFLFVYGAAFKPELDGERLVLLLDADQVEEEKRALAVTLNGPSREELAGYRDATGQPLVSAESVRLMAGASEYLAIKKGDRPRRLEESIEALTFDSQARATVLDGCLGIERTGPVSFTLSTGGERANVDLSFSPPVVPFATLPLPTDVQPSPTFGVTPLGTRSGFDLTGPTTGFLFWLNGRALIYDGPVGTRYLLERQGATPGDVGAVVLSHCHEDHMGAFVELLLGGHRPRVYTAEPIYRSMLVKLAHHLRMKEAEVAGFVDYRRVTPGVPVEIFGAMVDFFYSVHAIPTIGMSVLLTDSSGAEHRVQISGDTIGHEGLDDMRTAGVLDAETHKRMRQLVPASKVDRALYFADVGEAIIHGHPRDWQGNPNRILYYHCPDDERTRGFGHELAQAGTRHVLVEAQRFHPSVPARLLHALAFLDFRDPEWLATFLHRGRTRRAEAGEILVRPGDPADRLAIIVTGAAEVRGDGGTVVALLKPGELFGAIELVDGQRRSRAEVRAATPLELFEVEGALVSEYVETLGLKTRLTRAWAHRPHIDSARLFRSLDAPARSSIAALGTEEAYKQGSVIFTQGAVAEDFYLLVEGRVAVEIRGKKVREIDARDPDNFFGEISAVFPNRRRSATLRALTPVRAVRLRGSELRALFEAEMAVRYELFVTIRQRGGGTGSAR
jgi:CRP-like cAMP-binding protein